MVSYKIIRFYKDINKKGKVITRGLSLEEARAHCRREDTHEKDSDGITIWFDGYKQE